MTTITTNTTNFIFFLGGADAEMATIKELLTARGEEFCDNSLGWGARASAYVAEIAQAVEAGKTPVLLELTNAAGSDREGNALPVIDLPEGCVDIDHHNERSSEAAAIVQVCELLGLEPTRNHLLVAANDTGFIPAMQEAGATEEEITDIRALDRACQGITPEQEAEAIRAIAVMETINDLVVVRPSHSKGATVTDRLFGTQPNGQCVLILSGDGEVNFYGDGALCAQLKEKYADGWAGGTGLGTEGGSAFFGGHPNHTEVLDFIVTAQA